MLRAVAMVMNQHAELAGLSHPAVWWLSLLHVSAEFLLPFHRCLLYEVWT